jgi:hypothetical protein
MHVQMQVHYLLYAPRPPALLALATHAKKLPFGGTHVAFQDRRDGRGCASRECSPDVTKPMPSVPPGVVGTRGLVYTNCGGPQPTCPAAGSRNPKECFGE